MLVIIEKDLTKITHKKAVTIERPRKFHICEFRVNCRMRFPTSGYAIVAHPENNGIAHQAIVFYCKMFI